MFYIPSTWRNILQTVAIGAFLIVVLQVVFIPKFQESAFWIGLVSYFAAGIIASVLIQTPPRAQLGDEALAQAILVLLVLFWTGHYLTQGLLVDYNVTKPSLNSFMVYNITSALSLMLGASLRGAISTIAEWIERFKQVR